MVTYVFQSLRMIASYKRVKKHLSITLKKAVSGLHIISKLKLYDHAYGLDGGRKFQDNKVVSVRKPCTIATWNVRRLYQYEVERQNIGGLGINDVQ